MLTKEFILSCQSYARKRNKVLNESFEDTKKICVYNIEFYSYVIEFRYIKKESVLSKPSSLYCTIRLRKNSVVHYHLTDIIPFLKQKTFKSCCFWNIESPERLNNCFKCLEDILDNILSQIEPFILDDSILEEALFQSYKNIYNLTPNDIDFSKINIENDFSHSYFISLQKMRDEFIFSRYSSFSPYALLLKNDINKALIKYEKLNEKNKLLEYEKELINHINTSQEHEFDAFDDSCDTSASNKLESPASYLKSFIICFVISSIFFCGFCAIYNAISSNNTLVHLSSPWYTGFLSAALCSVFGAIAFFPYIPNQHLTKEERKNFSNVLVSKNVKRASFLLFAISVVASIFFTAMFTLSTVRFNKDNIQFDNLSYNYTQIDSVYHIEARYNVYGDRIERESYVILFNDKTSLDLDSYTSIEQTENEVVPLLTDKGFDVNYVDSQRDLPWYTE